MVLVIVVVLEVVANDSHVAVLPESEKVVFEKMGNILDFRENFPKSNANAQKDFPCEVHVLHTSFVKHPGKIKENKNTSHKINNSMYKYY